MARKKHDLPPPALIGGPYAAPRCSPGSRLRCQLRGPVKVGGLSDAPVPWPWTYDTVGGRGRTSLPQLILCGDLVKAVATESVQALAYHWGCDRKVVSGWRKALGVKRFNAGTAALWRAMAPAKLGPRREEPDR